MSGQLTRRKWLAASTTVIAATKLGLQPALAKARTGSDEIQMAVIGTGGRGSYLIQRILAAQGAKLVALCDADQNAVDRAAAKVTKHSGTQLDRFTDYRQLLERNEIDAVVIATPNHWHALQTIHACQAGKHVYVEKPVCHSVWEGRQMVEAMKQSGRLVEAGFQNRSDTGLRQAISLLQQGQLGPIKQLRGLCYRRRGSIGRRDTPLSPPKGVNYGLWLGPADDQPIMRRRFHYDWHWDFNTGNGDMGNQGPHEIDLLRWVLGDPPHPRQVMSFGGRFAWRDAGNTPNMQFAQFDFGNQIPVLFEVRNLHQKQAPQTGAFQHGPEVGIVVTCEAGEFRGGRGGGAFYDLQGKITRQFPGDSGKSHMQNFVDAVRNNDAQQLRAPLASSFYSSCVSHLANISVRTGQTLAGSNAQLDERPLAAEVFDRFSKQLALHQVDLQKTPWRIGAELTLDPQAEQFVAGETAKAANVLLRREGRKPHVIPELASLAKGALSCSASEGIV